VIYTKDYRVEFWYTEGGYRNISAKSPKDAERKVEKLLDEEGAIVGFTLPDYDCSHREWHIEEVEEA
jgi:hypothetical protein